jgi:radical SAM protein with 4Fe4S-binding SPASM domain
MKILLLILKRIFHNKVRYAHVMAFLKYNNPRKLINFIHCEYESRMRKIKVSSKPYLINSEPTSHCNLKCPFCPTGKRNTRKGGFAQEELYEKTFRQIGKYTYLITFHGWGEPLMSENLPEIIRLAHENRIFTVVTTNGSLLTDEMSEKIISSKLDHLVFSVDGIYEESYRKYRIGGSLETVLKNLRNLVLLKRKMESPTPFIEWQFIVFKHNEHEIDAARKLAGELGVDNIVFMPAYTEDASFDPSDHKYHLPKSSPLSKRSDCKHLWTTLTFHWSGSVVPCCYDYYGNIAYGNILAESFDQIWNNQKFHESRSIVSSGAGSNSEDLYCSSCVMNIKQAEGLENQNENDLTQHRKTAIKNNS